MRSKARITLTLPDLSPEAADALSRLLEDLAHKVELRYARQIRRVRRRRDREAVEIAKIEQETRSQQELELDDPIPF